MLGRSPLLIQIVCLAIGDLASTGKNLLVVLSAEGACHVFDVPPDAAGDSPLPDESPPVAPKNPNKLASSGSSGRGSTAPDVADATLSGSDGLTVAPAPAGTSQVKREGSGTISAFGVDPAALASVVDSSIAAAESTDLHPGHSATNPPKSATKSAKSGTMSFYSSIQTEKLAALSSRSGSNTSTGSQPGSSQSGNPTSSSDKSSRSDTHTGIATSLLDQFKRAATPTPSRPESPTAPTDSDSNLKPLKSSEVFREAMMQRSGAWKRSSDKMEPTYRFFVEPNANCAIIGDLDDDGKPELIVGSNNRAIYAYELVPNQTDASAQPYSLRLKARWHLASQVSSLCLVSNKAGRPVLLAGLTGGTYALVEHTKDLSYKQFGASHSSTRKSYIRDDRTGPAEIITTQTCTKIAPRRYHFRFL